MERQEMWARMKTKSVQFPTPTECLLNQTQTQTQPQKGLRRTGSVSWQNSLKLVGM